MIQPGDQAILPSIKSFVSGIDSSPQIAVYTVWTNKDGTLRGWPDIETAVEFISQSAYIISQYVQSVVLYTDLCGKELLKGACFHEIIVSLEGFDIEPSIRCACKLDSYSHQNQPFLHIEWDFILWRKPARRLMGPIFAQSRGMDSGRSRLSLIWQSLPWKPAFISSLLESEIPIELPCLSILGSMDVEFIRWYSELALEILRHPKNNFIQKLAKGELANDICIAMEQWLLGACAVERKMAIEYLCDEPSHSLNATDPSDIPRLGFTHLSADGKFSEYWKCEIKRLNAEGGIPSGTSETIELGAVPYSVLISMEKHHARRNNALKEIRDLGLDVEWRNPIAVSDISWGPTTQMYKSKPSSASHALTLVKLLDEIEIKGIECFALFEDDVTFRRDTLKLLSRIKVPRDWKFIYLGGRNCGVKEDVSPGLVRSSFVVDLHAVIIRSDMIDYVRQVLLDPCINSVYLDFRIATLHSEFPAYLCRPNLAWQLSHQGDSSVGVSYSNYNTDGTVKWGQGD